MSETVEQNAKKVAEAFGADAEAITQAFRRLAEAINVSPQAELKFRVQCAANGTDPGPALNTRYWRVS